MHTVRVLHLSNTDIRNDSRILKELSSIAKSSKYNVFGIGVASAETNHSNKQQKAFNIVTIQLITDLLKWFPRPIRYSFNLSELTVRLFWKGVRLRPNVVHCHDTMALPGATLIKLITGAKLIYDAHELESDKSGQTPSLSKATIIIERFCWSSIDHLISVSSSILNWYHSNLGSKPSSLVLNSPVIKESCSTSDRYFHDLYNISYDKLVFVYLGILGHGRAIEIILEAFCKEKIKSHVVFVGYGELESKIKEFSLQNVNIHLHKPVPHEEVVSLVKNADIGLCLIENVSLSDYYCLPNKLFEYTFAGTPVLASDFPEIRKFVEQYHLGSCCTLDPSSIFNSILDMENSKPERLTDDLAELSWQNQAKKLVTAYETLK